MYPLRYLTNHLAVLPASPPYQTQLHSNTQVLSVVAGEQKLGRITKDSMRGRIQEKMRHLRSKYREALKDDAMQQAFDTIWSDWNNEQAAMIYAGEVSALDLLNLTGVLSNRRDLENLRKRVETLENKRSPQ